MAEGFAGTPAQFADAHKKVSETKLAMDQNLVALANNIEATRDGWQGQASEVFRQVMEEFEIKSKKLNLALDHIGVMLQTSGIKYETQDADVNKQVSALQTVLDGLSPGGGSASSQA